MSSVFIKNDPELLFNPLLVRINRTIRQFELQAGYNVVFLETWRTSARQDILYNYGRKNYRMKKVTESSAWYSWHQYGLAADLVFDRDNKKKGRQNPYDGDFDLLGEIGEANGLTWGGRFKIADKTHFQFTMGVSIREALQITKAHGQLGLWNHILMLMKEAGVYERNAY